jgi:hypothetical protein
MPEEKIDFDRTLHDHEYRRMVIERLNREEADGQTSPKDPCTPSQSPKNGD